jgi:hypothetical protein
MMVFAPAGGGDIPTSTAGVVVGFALSGGGGSSFAPSLYEGVAIGFGVAVVVLGLVFLTRRGSGRVSRNVAGTSKT